MKGGEEAFCPLNNTIDSTVAGIQFWRLY